MSAIKEPRKTAAVQAASRAACWALVGVIAALGLACGASEELPRLPDEETRVIALKVEGMTWGGCVSVVRRALRGVEGVVAAEVSLEEMRAEVRCRLDFDQPQALVQAIEGVGFKARLVEAAAAGEPKGD